MPTPRHIDVEHLSQRAYQIGIDPLDWSEGIVETDVAVWVHVCAERSIDPNAHPAYTLDMTPRALARRILAGLLDAGWTPPTVHTAPPADATGTSR